MSMTFVDDSTSPTPSAQVDAPLPADIDLDRLARLVYQLMLNDLAIGRERGG